MSGPQQRQQQTLGRAGKDGGSRTGNDNSDAAPKAAPAAQKGGDASDGARDEPKTKTGESLSKFRRKSTILLLQLPKNVRL